MKKNLIEGMRQAAMDVAQDSFNKGYLSAIRDVRKGLEGDPENIFKRSAILEALDDLSKQVELVMHVKEEATKWVLWNAYKKKLTT